MDCRNFENFTKEFDRMCASYVNNGKPCYLCPFFELDCYIGTKEHPVEAVKILQQWSDSHPLKTRQSEFLKLFPNTLMKNGMPTLPPCAIQKIPDCDSHSCEKCAKQFWQAEIK